MGQPHEPAIVGKAKTHNGELAYSSIPRAILTKCEQILMGAMLREPFNVSKHIGQLNRVALSHADGNLCTAFLEMLDQFAQFGKYSPLSIRE